MAPVSAAERQRQCRARRNADPDRKERHLQKERDRWKLKNSRKKSIKEMSEREQRHKRKSWREQQRRCRLNQKATDLQPQGEPEPGTEPNSGPSWQKLAGQKHSKKTRRKLHVELKVLKKLLCDERRKKEKYKKRFERLLKRSGSPNTKRQYTRNGTKQDQHERFQEALVEDLQKRVEEAQGTANMRVITSLLSGSILKKYKLKKYAQETLGFTRRRWKTIGGDPYAFSRKKCVRMSEDLKNNVKTFYLRDDVSRMTTGKKQTVTKVKIRMQKRFLLDTLRNLHMKYLSDNPERSISYALFCRLRPYWVVHPTISDRSTCQCKLHENLGFIAQRLHSLALLATPDLDTLTTQICCDPNSRDCMHNLCGMCRNKDFPMLKEYEGSTQVEYWQWVTEETEHSKELTVFKKTVKKTIETSLEGLIELFSDMMSKYKRHLFNIRQQYRYCRELKQNLDENECIIHVDFSENYVCKYASEIQAVHFGASHEQATLHTGILYAGANAEQVCFSSISPSRQKGPPAIWEHLQPVLSYVKNRFPLVSVVHFLSDGPCSQYRQKGNFFLFTSLLYKTGFKAGTWNFFEASHGKGVPDGVGGTLKRTADRLVSHGCDLKNATDLFDALVNTNTTIVLFYVSEESIDKAIREMPENIPQVPTTMKIHQVVTTTAGEMVYRDVSCMCAVQKVLTCTCFGAKSFSFKSESRKSRPLQEIAWGPDVVDRWCVVKYDGDLYPGIIKAFDEVQAQVKCMHRVGVNRFFWPAREDVIWYVFDHVISFIPPPRPVTARHHEIERDVWAKLIANITEG